MSNKGTTNIFGGLEGQKFGRARVATGCCRRAPGACCGASRTRSTASRRCRWRPSSWPRAGRSTPSGSRGGAWIDFAGPPGHFKEVSFSRAVKRSYPPGTFTTRSSSSAPPRRAAGHAPHVVAGRRDGRARDPRERDETLLRGAPLHDSGGLADLLIVIGLALLPCCSGAGCAPLLALGARRGRGVFYVVACPVRVRARADPAGCRAAGRAGARDRGTLVGALATVTFERARRATCLRASCPTRSSTRCSTRRRGRPAARRRALTATVLFSDLRGFTTFAEGASRSR